MKNDKAYLLFVLGYDLMQEGFTNKGMTCDEAFNKAEEIYEEFMESNESKQRKSSYECLQDFLNEYLVKEQGEETNE